MHRFLRPFFRHCSDAASTETRHKPAPHVSLDALPLKRFRVEISQLANDVIEALRTLKQVYAGRGLGMQDARTLRITPQHLLDRSVILVAWERDRLVGTISVLCDSSAGLPLDRDYPRVLENLRRRGLKIAEVGSYAIHRDVRGSGVAQLLGFAAWWLAGKVLRVDGCVCGTHPRVQRPYRELYNLVPLGPPKQQAEFGAPVLPLFHDSHAWSHFVARRFTKRLANGQRPVDEFCGHHPPSFLHMPPTWRNLQCCVGRLQREDFLQVVAKHLEQNSASALPDAVRKTVISERGEQTLVGLQALEAHLARR